MTAHTQPNIGYVVKRYPRFSETFIVNEVLAHEAAGLPINIFSLRPPIDTHFQDLISRVRAAVTYLSEGRVSAAELWSALSSASRIIPDIHSRLESAQDESSLDAYCGIRLAEQSVRRGITHLHAHFASSSATVARIASLLTDIPYSITAHAKDIFHQDVNTEDLSRKLRDACVTFTVSHFNLEFLRTQIATGGSPIVRLYNGIPLEQFPFQSPRDRCRQIIAVGRFVEKKGFGDLIQACGILRDRGTSFRCLLVGGGELEQDLVQLVRKLNLHEQVKLLGPQPQRSVKDLIQKSAVMATPCVLGSDGNRDGLPTVLLEAMALGTPCVSTDVTGIPEIVRHQETGLIVSQNSPAELANSLTQVLAEPDLRHHLAIKARRLIESEFDIAMNSLAQRQYFLHNHLNRHSQGHNLAMQLAEVTH